MTELNPSFRERLQRFSALIVTRHRRHPALRYVVVGVVAFIFTFLVGNNSLFNYVKNEQRKAYIQEEYDRYLPQYEADSTRLSEIRDNREHIERIAREQYYMHLPGEEIFLLAPDTTASAQP
ncbi:FtsB family cell division protein [Porphyromonas sp.]